MKDKQKQIKPIVRIVLAFVFLIAGFNFSSTGFFDEYPLFGFNYLAEVLISLVAALVGYFLIPRYFLIAKDWLENLIVSTTYRVVSDFWNQYTQRMEQSRQERQKLKEKEKKEKEKKDKFKDLVSGGVVLDTSVLIDGRIIDISKSGFLPSPLILPKFVISELHLLADNGDDLKRKKGRRGLDMINKLKKQTKLVIANDKLTPDGVDNKIVEFAKDCKVALMTLDYNLKKVAEVENVRVLNINDLVEAVKPKFVPGEQLTVKIVQQGKEKGQGVGFLDDGTMIVVADAKDQIDNEIDVVVKKLIQSSAGKMVFCEVLKEEAKVK